MSDRCFRKWKMLTTTTAIIVLSFLVLSSVFPFCFANGPPIIINKGDPFTNDKNVDLAIDYTGSNLSAPPGLMMISNVYPPTVLDEEFYKTERLGWDLTYKSPGDGIKTVYVLFYSPYSDVYNDTIILDRQAPSLTFTATSAVVNKTVVKSKSLQLEWQANDKVYGVDEVSGVDRFEYALDSAIFHSLGAQTVYNLDNLSNGNHTFTLRVFDKAGNINTSWLIFTVNATGESPKLTVANLASNAEVTSLPYTVTWTGTDVDNDLDHYEVRVDSGGWMDIGLDTSYPLSELSNGNHTFSLRAIDEAGNIQTYTAQFTVNVGGEFPLWIVLVIVVVVIVIILVIVYLKFLRKKKPKGPAQVRITAEPTNLIADGEAQSVITIQLLDQKGNPIPAPDDMQVQINAAKGRVVTPSVTIPKGRDMEKTVLVSSRETGPVPVSASAEGLKSITLTLNFMEKKRYCMHCGALMPSKAKVCENCGKSPPAGVDTKVCHNCKSVIPMVAKFCSECGTGQKQ